MPSSSSATCWSGGSAPPGERGIPPPPATNSTPSSSSPQATGYDLDVVVLCSEGYTSSLAADALRSLGLTRASDVVGGYRAWAAAGLPVVPGTGTADRAPLTEG